MKEISFQAAPGFNALCASKFTATNRGSWPKPAGASCVVCVTPVKSNLCECADFCFCFPFPGGSWNAGGGPHTFVATNSRLVHIDGPVQYCLWAAVPGPSMQSDTMQLTYSVSEGAGIDAIFTTYIWDAVTSCGWDKIRFKYNRGYVHDSTGYLLDANIDDDNDIVVQKYFGDDCSGAFPCP